MSAWELVVIISGMAAITLVTRGFFFLHRAQLPVPAWLNEGLRYAPLAAMTPWISVNT